MLRGRLGVTTAGPDAALELAVEVFPQGFCIPPKARHDFEFRLTLLTDAGRKLSGRCLEIPIQPHCYGRFPNDAEALVDRAAVQAQNTRRIRY